MRKYIRGQTFAIANDLFRSYQDEIGMWVNEYGWGQEYNREAIRNIAIIMEEVLDEEWIEK